MTAHFLDCRKTPLGAFRQFFAVCCAHFVANPVTIFRFLQAENSTCAWFAPLPIKRILALWGPLLFFGEQILHLQPEKYFPSGTEGELPGTGKRGHPGVRPGKKYFSLYFLLTQKTLRGFFDKLRGYMLFYHIMQSFFSSG